MPTRGNSGHSLPPADGDKRQAPVIVSLGDDAEGFFQSSPPSPIDLAVILTNFQRLGAKKAATAAVLAWDAPDPIGLAALDKAIGRFDSLVMAAPLSRGAVPEPMPAAFRKASVPLAKIHGDPALLPVVNRVPLPGVILGKDNTLAGFQTARLGADHRFPPAARPLGRPRGARVSAARRPPTARSRRRAASKSGSANISGSAPTGPVLPIDRFGRLAVASKRSRPMRRSRPRR